jgi:hypothetical protein
MRISDPFLQKGVAILGRFVNRFTQYLVRPQPEIQTLGWPFDDPQISPKSRPRTPRDPILGSGFGDRFFGVFIFWGYFIEKRLFFIKFFILSGNFFIFVKFSVNFYKLYQIFCKIWALFWGLNSWVVFGILLTKNNKIFILYSNII